MGAQSQMNGGGILEVTVQEKLGDLGIVPPTITVTSSVHTVSWIGQELPEGAVLQIHFLEDLRGPFKDLTQSQPKVSGYGNRGPQETVEEYDYQARIIGKDGTSRLVGSGRLINHATQEVSRCVSPDAPGDSPSSVSGDPWIGDPPPAGPPYAPDDPKADSLISDPIGDPLPPGPPW